MKQLLLIATLFLSTQIFSQEALNDIIHVEGLVEYEIFSQDTLQLDEDDLNEWPRIFGGTSFDTVRALYKIAYIDSSGLVDSIQGFKEKGFAVILKEVIYQDNLNTNKGCWKGADYTLVEFLDENKQQLPKNKIIWDYILLDHKTNNL